MTRATVLGAGLTGVGTALELARRGVDVTLLDQDEMPVNRASLRNEGKIHLGLIYANDTSLVTARMQLEGALHFRSLLSRWVGSAADRLSTSTPFVYLVASDSAIPTEDIEAHYASVQTMYRDRLANDPTLDYLGGRPARLFEKRGLDEIAAVFDTQYLAAAFETAERAIDTDELARLLRKAVAESPRIRFLPRRRVEGVERKAGALRIEGSGPEGLWQVTADHVVNALWEDRRRIDRTCGLAPEPGWVHRLRFRVIVRLPDALRGGPSATMVLGRYGDAVIRPNGTAYLSWYPLGLRGWTHELQTPASWNGPCRGEVDAHEARSLAAETIAAIDAWYPGIGASKPLRVDAGVIVAYGYTDVDDVQSALHDRSRIGVISVDGYHSVEPGKLTTAPLMAKIVADRVLEREAVS